MNKPRVFVASTCHDMVAERTALADKLHFMGWEPLSSDGNFGVIPIANSHDACLAQLRQSHIFVLILGHRYGGKYRNEDISITQKEFREARDARMPVYILARKSLMADNRKIQTSGLDAINLSLYAYANSYDTELELRDKVKAIHSFLDEVRRLDEDPAYRDRSNWVFEFDSVSELVEIVMEQLAYFCSILLDMFATTKVRRTNIEIFTPISIGNTLTFATQHETRIARFQLKYKPILSTLLVWEGALCFPPQCYRVVESSVLEVHDVNFFEAEFSGDDAFTVRYEYVSLSEDDDFI